MSIENPEKVEIIKKDENELEQFKSSLISKINEITKEMKEKGLDSDAEIMAKIPDRLNRYFETIKNNKKIIEEKWKRKISLWELNNTYNFRFCEALAITRQEGKDGGAMVFPNGSEGLLFKNLQQLENSTEKIDEYKKQGAEVVNYSLSDQGREELFKKFGLLRKEQTIKDFEDIYEKENRVKLKFDPSEYFITRSTNINDVSLDLKNSVKENQKWIRFRFNNVLLKKLFEE